MVVEMDTGCDVAATGEPDLVGVIVVVVVVPITQDQGHAIFVKAGEKHNKLLDLFWVR